LTDWLNRIDENFEKEFWIDETNSSQYVNRKLIYKDTVNSSLQWTDFQLRPNFLVAAVLVSFILLACFFFFKKKKISP
jgi:glycogen debranching enzyme